MNEWRVIEIVLAMNSQSMEYVDNTDLAESACASFESSSTIYPLMKRLIMCALLGFVVALTGCNQSQDNSAPSTPSTNEPANP